MLSDRSRWTNRRVPLGLRLGMAVLLANVMLLGCARQGPLAPIDNRGNLFFGRGTALPVARPAAERPQSTAARAIAPQGTTAGVITVQSGDTLYEVSRRNNVPIQAIITANNLTPPYNLTAGRQLTLPQQSYHRVSNGETVATIARTYGVSMQDLMRSNGIEPPYLIYVGQPILIPSPISGAAQPAVTVAAQPPLSSSSPASPIISQSSISQTPPRPGPGPGPETMPAPAPASAEPPNAVPPDRLASLPPPPIALAEPAISAPPGSFIWPVQGRVLSGFGPKSGGLVNDGINIAAPLGTPVRASQDGTIAYAGNELRGYGNLLLLRHDNGWVTAYAHNGELQVGRGDRVKRGQVIARVGASGSVTEPQLHFELRQGTRTVDPTRYLSGQGFSG